MSGKLDLTGACKPLADIFASASEREEQRKAAVAKRSSTLRSTGSTISQIIRSMSGTTMT